jgi:hypothetical protein
MKNRHAERGTTYTSLRHRPGEHPTVAESKTPERSVEGSMRGAQEASMPPEMYGARGDFKPSPEHEAESRVGLRTPGGTEAAQAPVRGSDTAER